MFLKLGPASLSLSSVKFGKGGYAVFRNEHFHFGVAVQELPFWFCTLFRFRGHCHFLVKQTLGIHFRRNPLSRNSWRKRDPVSKEKDLGFIRAEGFGFIKPGVPRHGARGSKSFVSERDIVMTA